MAVGAVGNKNTASLAERWDGSRWSIVATPADPDGLRSPDLIDVSCVSSTDCVAVGESYLPSGASAAGGAVSFAEQWNGARWSLLPALLPDGSVPFYPRGVSCASSGCIVAGAAWDEGANSVAVIERWRGSTWSIDTAPIPPYPGTQRSYFTAASCTSGTSCVAVGSASSARPDEATLVENWNGTTWATQPSPNWSTGTFNELTDVSCSSATACIAIGDGMIWNNSGRVGAEQWNGASWSLQKPLFRGYTPPGLSGVSCPAANMCVVVGAYESQILNPIGTLAERWNGVGWSAQPTPSPARKYAPELDDVSCASNVFCMAVGDDSLQPLAMLWTPQANPVPPDNEFTITHVTAQADGAVSFRVKVPGPGSIDVLETAWSDNLSRAGQTVADVRLQPAAGRFVIARSHMTANRSETVRVVPNERGRLLVLHHRYRVVLRLWVSYTPVGGSPRTIGFYGLHLGGACPGSVSTAPRTKVECAPS
jgi:hypothetical protein